MLPRLITLLLTFFPVALLTSSVLPSAIFYALCLVALALLAKERFSGATCQTYTYRWLIVSYSVLFLAVVISSIYHGEWAGANSEGALRFLIGVWLLLLALPHVSYHNLSKAIWGVYAAGLISTAVLFWLMTYVEARPLTPGVILTTYTSLMLLLGALSIYSLKWPLTTSPKGEFSVKIIVAVATFSGFVAAQTRTGLLGLPTFVVLGIILFVGIKKPIRLIAWTVISLTVLLAAAASNEALVVRIAEGLQQLDSCQHGSDTQSTSICIRLQMWRTAIDAGTSHPWVGLGEGGKFNQYMNDVAVPKGLVAQEVVDRHFGEPHNDLLLFFTGFGFPGLIGLLLIYLAPCAYFLPRLLNTELEPRVRAAAAMGLAVCLSFFLFGFTETMFRRMSTMGFYAVMVAWFLVLSDPRTPTSKNGDRNTI